jgi:NAD(P)H-flavin reductase
VILPTLSMPIADDLYRVLGTDAAFQREQLGQAVKWLVENLDRPYTVSTGCAQLGSALGSLGVSPQRLEMLALVIADVLRAGLGPGATQQQHEAWQRTGELVARWVAHGMQLPSLEPAFWTGVVMTHRRPAPHLAVLSIRTYLPYPYLAGQYATVETQQYPHDWRQYWIGSAPNPNNRVELHVRRTEEDKVATALVAYTKPGDTVRLHVPGGAGLPVEPTGHRPLLVIAEDVAIAPARAVVAQLRRSADRRPVHLYWGVPTEEDLYDLDCVLAMSDEETSIVPAVRSNSKHVDHDERHVHGRAPDVAVGYDDWSGHDVLVYGSPTLVARCQEMFTAVGVPAEQISGRTLQADPAVHDETPLT